LFFRKLNIAESSIRKYLGDLE